HAAADGGGRSAGEAGVGEPWCGAAAYGDDESQDYTLQTVACIRGFCGLPADRRSPVDPPDDVIRVSGDARIGDAGPILISAGQVNVARSGERKLVLWGQLVQRPCRRSLL